MSATHPIYRRTQVGTALLLATSFGAAFPLYALSRPSARADVVLVALCGGVLLVLLAAAVCFATLTVRVDGDQLSWSFGLGIIQRSVPLKEIIEIGTGRTSAFAGWGIRWTADGTLYNVSGFSVVRLKLHDGTTLMLGSDDPEQLATTIRQARERSASTTPPR